MEKEKRKRRHSSHHHGNSSSKSESGSESNSSGSESSSGDSGSEPEEELHHRPKKARTSVHKHKHRTKRKKEHKAKPKGKKERISMDDYYSKSSEFRSWLSKERGVFFSDLTSEQSRKLFKKFVHKWNNGLLKKKYYKGIQSASLGHSTQTKYKWKFASSLDKGELKNMRERVSSWTEAGEEDSRKPAIGPSPTPIIGPARRPPIGPAQGPSRPRDPFVEEERQEMKRDRLRGERREFRQHHKMVLDELLPRATGREARVEKKRARAEERQAREVSPDAQESMLMGSSGNIQKRIQARQEQRYHKSQAAHQKIADYQAKEKAKMAALLEMAKASKKEGAMW